MVKIFIIDDEILIRMGIRMMADWKDNGIEIVGEAANGQEALGKIAHLQPDIIITDLMMPIMDGITLIKELKRTRFKGKTIVLSNYNEFELVKEAMKSGAAEYLLKVTLDSNELVKLIKALSEDLVNQQEEENINTKLKIELNENRSVIKEKLINAIKSGSSTKRDIENKIRIYDFKLSNHNIAIAAVIDDVEKAIIESRMKDEGLLNFTIENILDETVNRRHRGEVFFLRKGIFIILFNMEQDGKGIEDSSLISDLCIEMKTLLKRYLDLDTCFVYKNNAINVESLGDAINQVISKNELRFYSEDTFILDADKAAILTDRIDDEFWKLKQELKDAIDIYPEKVEAILENIFVNISKNQYVRTLVNQIFRNLITLFEEAVMKENGDLYKVMDRDSVILLEAASSLNSFKSGVTEICHKAMQLIDTLKNESLREDVIKAINYIKIYYREKISLEDISQHVNMNKNYFCKLFKDETGLSPVEYIINYKMDKAKELLKLGGMNVSEVAKAMGYVDISYFNRLFKKHVGVSPGSYVK